MQPYFLKRGAICKVKKGYSFFRVGVVLEQLGIAKLAAVRCALIFRVINSVRALAKAGYCRVGHQHFPSQTFRRMFRGKKRKGPALKGQPFFMVEIS